jgi:hypothetical protein
MKPIWFDPGRVVITPGAMDLLHQHGVVPSKLLMRHAQSDWGDLDAQDKKANDSANQAGRRLFSSYNVGPADKVWIISEAVDVEAGQNPQCRELTTLLCPDEY